MHKKDFDISKLKPVTVTIDGAHIHTRPIDGALLTISDNGSSIAGSFSSVGGDVISMSAKIDAESGELIFSSEKEEQAAEFFLEAVRSLQ